MPATRLLRLVLLASGALAASAAAAQQWGRYAGGADADRYSPLDLINAANVDRLKILWERPAIDASLLKRFPDAYPTSYFRGTPIVVGDVLYAPDGIGLVEAFDGNGRTLWIQRPFAETMREVAGISTRGVDHWGSGSDSRILAVRGEWLYALDAKTGAFIRSFGNGGRVYLRRRNDGVAYFGSNGPLVVGDVVIVSGNGGGNAGDGGVSREGTPEDVRAFDVRTGRPVWTFHVMPQPGDPARATWGPLGAAGYSGNMGAWATMSADEELGIVYIPLSSVSTAYYGGHRPGDNLYSNALVALDARTGRLLWQHQLVHHDLWDYDTASPPALGSITVDGRRRDIVIQPSKTGNLFVFDRRTGAPIWPIVERPVPRSDVPDEAASPTQPFPSKPPPFDWQGVSEQDLIDFTPALNAEARAIASRYRLGPLFTPPSLRGAGGKQGTLSAPGAWGSGNWNTGAFDPETGWYYAVSMSSVTPYALQEPKTKSPSTIRYAFVGSDPAPPPETALYGIGPQGLPLLKPPYGRITAYDLNRGAQEWMVANGDGPRDHPLLKALKLPPLGTPGRPAPLLTKSLLFVGESSDALFGEHGVPGPSTFRAYDKRTGAVIAAISLPAGATGGPMTYVVGGRQIILVPVGSKRQEPRWVALGLADTAQ